MIDTVNYYNTLSAIQYHAHHLNQFNHSSDKRESNIRERWVVGQKRHNNGLSGG
jgi:hypothetical protein